MQRFTFNLEPVRALREQAEEHAKHELAHQLGLQAARVEELSQASSRLAAARASGALVAGATVSGHDLEARRLFVERVEREQRAARARLEAQEGLVEHGRLRLAQAARERQVLERLREQRLGEHTRALARSEQATLGEIALAAHRRRSQRTAA
jgi:flagellar export protein FliJ